MSMFYKIWSIIGKQRTNGNNIIELLLLSDYQLKPE